MGDIVIWSWETRGHFSSLLSLHLTLAFSRLAQSLLHSGLLLVLSLNQGRGRTQTHTCKKVRVYPAPGDTAWGVGSLHC